MFLTRLRHRYGFGVHSPFAFEIITEAVRQSARYAYYEEHALSVARDIPGDKRTHLKRIIRLKNLLRRHNITLICNSLTTGNAADKPHISDDNCNSVDAANRILSLPGNAALYIINPDIDCTRRLHNDLARSGGLLISGKDFLLAVNRHDMAFQCYIV